MEATSPNSDQAPELLRFGLFEVNRETGELRKGGIRIKLQEQPFQVLAALTETPGELVTRDQLRGRLWPGGEFVDYDHALTTAVKKLRGALNDSPTQPRYVETLPRRGYRFIAPVERVRPSGSAEAAPEPRRPAESSLLLQRKLLAAALAATTACALWLWGRAEPPTNAPQLRRFSFDPGGGLQRVGARPVISPDGQTIAFATVGPTGSLQLRSLDDEWVRTLDGTENASRPVWSPDSQSLAFRDGSELKRVSVHGGPVSTVCDLPGSNFIGASWHPSGERIIFSSGVTPHLWSVDAAGGEPEPYLDQDRQGGATLFPHFISDRGEPLAVAFATGGPTSQELVVADLNSDRRVRLGPGAHPWYDPAGYLLFQSSGGDEGLWALPFSAETLEPLGSALPVDPNGAAASVSSDGTLVYSDAQAFSGGVQLSWRDRAGVVTGTIGPPQNTRIRSIALSPDERYVAAEAVGEGGDNIWVYDSQTDSRLRLTLQEGLSASPVWHPDGTQVAYRQDREGNADVFARAFDRSAEAEVLLATSRAEVPSSFSPDGSALVYTVSDERTKYDVWMIEDSPENPRPLLIGAHNETAPAVSPDGQWLAFCSDEAGEYEVHVQPFPAGGRRVQVSQAGGCQPRWSANGRELFYVQGDQLHAVEVLVNDGGFVSGSRAALFRHPSLRSRSPLRTSYDVSGDGAHFVTVDVVDEDERIERRIRVVENWTAMLDR